LAGKPVKVISSIRQRQPDQHTGGIGTIRCTANESAAAIRERLQLPLDLQLQPGTATAVLQRRRRVRRPIPMAGENPAPASDDGFRGIRTPVRARPPLLLPRARRSRSRHWWMDDHRRLYLQLRKPTAVRAT